MTAINQEVIKDPAQINVDGYGRGLAVRDDRGVSDAALSVSEYHEFLTANWDQTQRHTQGPDGRIEVKSHNLAAKLAFWSL